MVEFWQLIFTQSPMELRIMFAVFMAALLWEIFKKAWTLIQYLCNLGTRPEKACGGSMYWICNQLGACYYLQCCSQHKQKEFPRRWRPQVSLSRYQNPLFYLLLGTTKTNSIINKKVRGQKIKEQQTLKDSSHGSWKIKVHLTRLPTQIEQGHEKAWK